MSNDTGGFDCSSYDWFLLSGCVGAVSSVAAIVLILCSKAYKDFSYRLYLYIAVNALVLSVCWCAGQVIPVPETTQEDHKINSNQSVIAIHAILVSLIDLSAALVVLVSCWLSFHILLMVVCRVTRLKKRCFEVVGVVLVLVLSLPFAVGTMALYFVVIDPSKLQCNYEWVFYVLQYNSVTAMGVPSILGVIFTSIAVVALIIRSLCSTQLDGGVRKFYRQALKSALPFLLLQICGFHYISFTVIIFRFHDGIVIAMLLYPCSFVLLPLLLLCQPQVTRNLKCRRGRGRGRGKGDEDCLETAPFSRWSTAVTSRTHFIVPPESFFTEQDPLVIRQETDTVV